MKLLVLRFSALGDVMMSVPLVDALARRYPDLDITVLSRRPFEAPFRFLPANVRFWGVDLNLYKGVAGLNRLYREIRQQGFTHVADLHDVLRTRYLRTRCRLGGLNVRVIDKGRADKRRLTRRRHKVLHPLPTGFERYRQVFADLGFPLEPTFRSLFAEGKPDIDALRGLTGEKGGDKWIAVAPFAKHTGKIYPLDRMQQVVDGLRRHAGYKVFVFGGGAREKAVADAWRQAFPEIVSVIGQLTMEQELQLLAHMDVTLTMDSANMHLAALAGCPVVSVWGATHPFAGFLGWRLPADSVLQADLPCRPCSVFGQKPCFRGDYACLHAIAPETVIEKIHALLS